MEDLAMISLEYATLGNAAGFVKTKEKAEALLNSAATRITIGSVKLEPWPGNSGETYHYDSRTKTAWNSKGLDTLGVEKLLEWLPEFYRAAKAAGKEVVVSIAASDPEEYGTLARLLMPYCDRIEVNAGCGNVWGPEGQKPIPSYEPLLLDRILGIVDAALRNRPIVTVKVSPVPDPLIEPLASVLAAHPCVVEVICGNTLPLQEGVRDDGSPALDFLEPGGTVRKHAGGMSGKPLKPHSMRVLAGLVVRVPRLRYVGCGGGDSGQDLLDYLGLGAAGMEVGTEFDVQGRRIFQDIYEQAARLLEAA